MLISIDCYPTNSSFVLRSDNMANNITVRIKSQYSRYENEDVDTYGTNLRDPYKYYYNTLEMYRYPISAMKGYQVNRRLTIDRSTNPNVNIIKSNHLHVCRYFNPIIPENGFFDVTGYIPTPLSRHRYEWWVNGRQINDENHLVILSPTSFQLTGLTSLKNFELIELVDDMNDSDLMKKGCVFVDINGISYSTYESALASDKLIMEQKLQYTYNGFPNHTPLQDYSNIFIPNPNNHDLEVDILSTIQSSDSNTSYNDLSNIPTINGVPIYHPTTDDLGIREVNNKDIVPLYDNAWKRQILMNPDFPMTHYSEAFIPDNEYLNIHAKWNYDDQNWTIYTTGNYPKYFTMYLSLLDNGRIDDVQNTKMIIPLIRAGVRINIAKEYNGLWIHTTAENYVPMKLQ